ncbi:DUF421 domain-containing protein [Halalkalibacterium halodurans]|uniref:DUF421 domain-containing protein n=1 Tax=Halalkalibacterium halodurans TaxID=86665 RepID=UPI001068BED6|nr:DUF421 domain-containing protein [Halalkalibacterium halodurans]TES45823.1 DUF421 domain-containing protein [Halalkalibacterium halodurans]
MDFHFIWKAIVIVFGGVLILRLAGRKSISQMTVAQTVMMIAIGSLIIQPVGDRNIWITIAITLLLVLTLLFIEYIVLKNDTLERFFYGQSIVVIENGQLQEQNLKKQRLTVDMLELRLRQQGIQHMSDVQWATIESNGQLGYSLKPEKQAATKEDMQKLQTLIQTALPNAPLQPPMIQPNETGNLFTEVAEKKHQTPPPTHLE